MADRRGRTIKRLTPTEERHILEKSNQKLRDCYKAGNRDFPAWKVEVMADGADFLYDCLTETDQN